jgi:hypothetical protein
MKKSHEIDQNLIEKHSIAQELGPFADFFIRLKDNLIGGDIFGNIGDWLIENTTLAGKPFSFFEHEFQKEIAADGSPDGVIMKCSQVGLTELAVRIALAFLGISNGRSLIYVLPTSNFAAKFCKSRIDPIIDNSRKLEDLLVTAANSASMKRFGDSFLYINGAANENQAISVPAEGLFVDEYDRCNQAVIGMYNSRSRHTKGDHFKRKWSTPTVDGYGVDELYAASRKARYAVKCDHCEQWQFPDFFRDVVIPGFEYGFEMFDRDHLTDPEISWRDAYIACPGCRLPLDRALANPARRQWVQEYPDRDVAGYHVLPFDLIAYNTTPKVIEQIKDYPRTSDYRNMVHGLPYTAANAKFDAEVIRKLTKIMEDARASGCCVGVDVGKVCYIVIGKKVGPIYHITKLVRLKLMDGSLLPQFIRLFGDFGLRRMVIDAGPDFELVKSLQERYGDLVNPCVYVKDDLRITNYYTISEVEKTKNVANAQRTKGFDSLVEATNAEKFLYPISAEIEEFKQHMKGMVRVETINEDGELEATWVKKGPDHYLHALFYFKLACDIEGAGDNSGVVAAPYGVSGIMVGNPAKRGNVSIPEGSTRALAAMLGVR